MHPAFQASALKLKKEFYIMGKLYLLLVLSLVLVVSIAAQTHQKYVDNFDMANSVKIYLTSSETKFEPSQTFNKKVEINSPKAQQAPLNAPATSSPAHLQVSDSKQLGGLSTGDSLIDSYIVASCNRYSIDPLLIFAQMNQESSFKLKATSYKGARGLMQLMPATAIRLGVKNIYDPQQNIEAGVKYMRWLLDQFGGDIQLALAGYNAGEGAVRKYGNRIPPFRETQGYVARITARYDEIKNPMTVSSVTTVSSIN
jgi:soluble lytic murein transglycosylase-like protein